jgi:hypothetical protein
MTFEVIVILCSCINVLVFICREKRKKPKFIVTLEGVGSEFEEKYEKEHSKRKKRRKSSQKDEVQPEINRDVPIMPVYPQLIHGVHQVPGMIPAHLNPAMPAPQPVHILPPPPPPGMITAPHVPIPTTIQNGKLCIINYELYQ